MEAKIKIDQKTYLRVVSILIFLVLWQLFCTFFSLGEYLPKPTSIMAKLYDMTVNGFARYSLPVHALYSTKRVLTAFGLGAIVGVTLGTTMGWNRTVRAIFNPLFGIIRSIPPIAWIPLLIMWFGIGETSKVTICFLGTFMPSTINSFNGIRCVDDIYLDSIKVLGGGDKAMFFEAAIPSAYHAIFAGLQQGMSSTWITLLAAEMVSSNEGLGYIILKGMERNDTTVIFAGMVAIAIVGILCAALMRFAERVVTPWQQTK